MYVVVGLGNPGKAYTHTRHNLGYMVLEKAAERWGVNFSHRRQRLQGEIELKGQPVLLVIPTTWMNEVGMGIQAVIQDYQTLSPAFIVVHDDLDLPLGTLRIKTRGGAGGHNGISSVISCLGTEEFFRLKLGIGRPQGHEDVARYVLSPFSADECAVVDEILPKAVDALEALICEGATAAMNRFHIRPAEGNGEAPGG